MSMNKFFQPKNALKRAEDLEAVGKPNLALETLHDLLNSSKHKKQWTAVHEEIMIKFLDLCMQLKRAPEAKDGLYQFKIVTGTSAVNSLEKVVRYYLKTAEDKVAEAWQQSQLRDATNVNDEIDDLEEAQTPEQVLLAAVSADGETERANRVQLMPWLRYLWEAYRAVLELLRHHSKMEHAYHATARQAMRFCHQYERRNEFRRLCNMLSLHLNQWRTPYQSKSGQAGIDINNPQTIQYSLDTRFELISYAGKLEQWQEAFRAMEEVTGLLDSAPEKPSPPVWGIYYHKLAQIFWRSKDYAFHAAAWHQMFDNAIRNAKSFNRDDIQYAASAVLLASLTVPLANLDTMVKPMEGYLPEVRASRQQRLAGLLGLSRMPSRDELLQYMFDLNVMTYVHPALKDLYNLVEDEFDPLQLSQKAAPVLEFLKSHEQFAQYVTPLKYILLLRLLKQLSQLYSSLKLERCFKLASFMTPEECEEVLVHAVQDKVLQLRIDHARGSLHFNNNIFAFNERQVNDGPKLQNLQAEMMNGQLTTLSRRLYTAINMIKPAVVQESQMGVKAINRIKDEVAREHVSNLSRRDEIEKQKEELEQSRRRRHQEQMQKHHQNQMQVRQKMAEAVKKNQEELERQKLQLQREEIERQKALEALNDVSSSSAGQKVVQALNKSDLGTKITAQDIHKMAYEQQKKDARERQERLRAEEKRLDHMERAKRLREIPRRKEHIAAMSEQNAKWHTELQSARLEKARVDHAKALGLKELLKAFAPDKDAYIEEKTAERRKEYMAKLDDFKQRMQEQKIRLEREERERKREEKRRAEEEEQRRIKQEEEDRKQREREAKREQERQEQLKLEEAERKKMEEATKLQRQREEQVRAREQEKLSNLSAQTSQPTWKRSARSDAPTTAAPSSMRVSSWKGDASDDSGRSQPFRPSRGGERDSGRSFSGLGDRGDRAPRDTGRSFSGLGDRGDRAPRDTGRSFSGLGDRAPRDFSGRSEPSRSGPRDFSGRSEAGRTSGERRALHVPSGGADKPSGDNVWRSSRGAGSERRVNIPSRGDDKN
ncbi:uncharacterized protein MONBRDRAFT_33388 [Monosiga brevicollis MX1]|uniref:Eukaryotic translation initiation factor 3 subunit A n=1 Tax=Monosiga brevicollis TaxID=81824 RepID=EIF3A_MONBE|nr:uncharacterized protein MONBRDRAFT_33388 [Monosiga brevicollis MX1]A9V549.1 RecName: Full=Eukaryotic translation initiation factor 3 subunit A; Short=eIF3a; AltName: Full=Eukaryotic translation initiation factor 3 subunit 10 [Monosiga brevicollis]EDQ87212.1 predicted protein [Monosiga brevicollis MX1]|eukprot:XP_001747825.1 hypothetical protein [Monosiga brevicollis MX1]